MVDALDWWRFHAPLRFSFKHASADRSVASSVLVRLRLKNGVNGYGEACPRAYVTGETEASVIAFLETHGMAWAQAVGTLDDLSALIASEATLIDRNPAAFGALEMAILDAMARAETLSIEALLSLPPIRNNARYTAVLGDSGALTTGLQGWVYARAGFRDYKVKLGRDPARDARRFATLPRGAQVRVDANNLHDHPDACCQHLSALNRSVWAIEEPLQPGDVTGQAEVARRANLRIILDESLTKQDDLHAYGEADPALRWIANIRVSKSGGILRSIALARAAQAMGMDIILGAHVGETSLLTRAAMTVAQSLSTPPLAREGAFGRILVNRDICRPSLRFGRSGVLRPGPWQFDQRYGFGLNMSDEEK